LTQRRKPVRTQQKNRSRNVPADFNKTYSGFVEGKRENVQKEKIQVWEDIRRESKMGNNLYLGMNDKAEKSRCAKTSEKKYENLFPIDKKVLNDKIREEAEESEKEQEPSRIAPRHQSPLQKVRKWSEMDDEYSGYDLTTPE
jgi:hypothetical protein